jgi:excisionase family DNA binding protein
LDLIGSAFAGFRQRPPDNGDLMTLEEVASRLGTDVAVVRRAIAKGDLPAVRIAKDLRVERSALECALAIAASNYGPL